MKIPINNILKLQFEVVFKYDHSQVYSELRQISKIGLFEKIVKGF